MSVTLLHYRAWQGQFRRPLWGIWPIARTALRMLFRRRLFWVLYAFGLLIFFMFFFGGYLLDWAETQVATSAFRIGRLGPDEMVRMFRRGLQALNGSQQTYELFFRYQGAMVMIVLALTGAVLVGNDFLYGSVPFYLAKPLSRWHYVLGKCLAAGAVVHLMTTVPALLLYAQHALGDWDYLTDPDFFAHSGTGPGPAGLPLLLGVLGYGMVVSAFVSVVLVAAASWVRRTMPLVLVWTTVFVFFRMLSEVLVDGLQYDEHWRLMDLWNNLRLVGCACLAFAPEQITPQPQPETWAAALVLGGVCLLCLSYLSLRTRAVEIVK